MLNIDYREGDEPLGWKEKLTFIIFSLCIILAFCAEIFLNFEPIKLTILFFMLAWVPLVFLHELGHALMARFFGWGVEEFVIGYGRILKIYNYKGTRVELRIMPLGGYILPKYKDEEWSRARGALVYFAGPGAELLVFFTMYFLIGAGDFTQKTTDYSTIMMQGIGASAVVGAVTNLIPFEAETKNGVVPNDGYGIILSLFGRR